MTPDDSFNMKYQEHCDALYWQNGQCCAGCDHWRSDCALSGECTASPIVSGFDVMRSMGIHSSSVPFKPGHPVTNAKYHCGMFRDDFDWPSLGEFYLRKIGAIYKGKMQQRPSNPQPQQL